MILRNNEDGYGDNHDDNDDVDHDSENDTEDGDDFGTSSSLLAAEVCVSALYGIGQLLFTPGSRHVPARMFYSQVQKTI